jgi:hypothetical protein
MPISSEWIDFRSALWRPVQDVRERAEIYRFLTLATEQICAAGLLPCPREELAPFEARVEVMRVGGKTFPHCVQLVGGPERPFSSMTPAEIEELHEQRRKEFWRNIDPATGLTDPSLPRAATPRSSSTSCRNRSNSSSAAATPSSSAQIAFIVSTNGPRCWPVDA